MAGQQQSVGDPAQLFPKGQALVDDYRDRTRDCGLVPTAVGGAAIVKAPVLASMLWAHTLLEARCATEAKRPVGSTVMETGLSPAFIVSGTIGLKAPVLASMV